MRTASRQGLLAIFGSTLFQLTGIFMLSPLLLLLLVSVSVVSCCKGNQVFGVWPPTTDAELISAPVRE